MIRILQVVGTMDLGGIETFIMNLYRLIDREQIQFDFLCHNRIEAKYTNEILSLGGKMYCVRGISHIGLFKYEESLYTFFKEHGEYRVVHAHQNDLNGIILKQAKKAGIKHRYSHSHTAYTGSNMLDKLRIAAFKIMVNNYCTRAFACSKPAGERLYGTKSPKGFEIIPNGIDTNRFQYNSDYRATIREQLGIKDAPVIGHVGSFLEAKNHKFILECFKEFLKVYPSAKLVLVGTGKLEDTIKLKAEEMGIKKSICFTGAVTDVHKYLSAMDLFLFPSIYEGLPVAIVEAQASGLRILISDSISPDCVLTDLVTRKALLSPVAEWVSELVSSYLAIERDDRSVYSQIVCDKGFDIRSVVKELSQLYVNDYYEWSE